MPWLIALSFVLVWSAAPAAAQCRLCAAPTTLTSDETVTPVKLEVETSLDFDRLVLAGSGAGSALVAPDGSRQTSGTVVSIGGRAMAGTITVRGEPGRAIRVGLPQTISLFGTSGGQVRIDSIKSDLSSMPRIAANGSLTIHFGGELHVDGTLDGDFRGDFSVDVDYL
ncbi:MAG: DUF4402 domain-containing protein [Sphingomicrobium sp.]